MENNSNRWKEPETFARERNVRKEKTKKQTTVTMANFTPEDRAAKRRTRSSRSYC